MPENTVTTFEMAKQCPKCGNPGKEVMVRSTKNSRGEPCQLHVIECVRELCRWFGERYVVQTNNDGTIPAAYSGVMDKQFPRISQESQSRIQDNVERQLEVERRGGEIKNPRG
jgi:hypothetical protein